MLWKIQWILINIINDDLKKFLMELYSDYFDNIGGLINKIEQVEIKNTTRKYQNLPFKFMVMFICV